MLACSLGFWLARRRRHRRLVGLTCSAGVVAALVAGLQRLAATSGLDVLELAPEDSGRHRLAHRRVCQLVVYQVRSNFLAKLVSQVLVVVVLVASVLLVRIFVLVVALVVVVQLVVVVVGHVP